MYYIENGKCINVSSEADLCEGWHEPSFWNGQQGSRKQIDLAAMSHTYGGLALEIFVPTAAFFLLFCIAKYFLQRREQKRLGKHIKAAR